MADAADSKSATVNPKCPSEHALTDIADAPPAVAPATAPDSTPEDARLAALVDAWPALPEPVRAGIAAMVGASLGQYPEARSFNRADS